MNNNFRLEKVTMTKGDFKGQTGTWLGISGYTNGYGCVCKIEIDNQIYQFTSDFFQFIDEQIQCLWDSDIIDFCIDYEW